MEGYNAEDDIAGFTAWLEFLVWLREASEAITGANTNAREPDATEPLRGSNGID